MKVFRETIPFSTSERLEFRDITEEVMAWLERQGIREGLLVLTSLHTTVALFVSEVQETSLENLKLLLGRLVEEEIPYRHNDPRYSDCDRGNAASHLRATLLGQSVSLPIFEGRLKLERLERIIFVELDGPRERRLALQAVGV